MMLIISLLAYRLLSKDWLETSFLALIPNSEQRPDIAKAIKQHEVLLNRKVIWLVGASTSQTAIADAKQLQQQLQQTDLFNKLLLDFSQQATAQHYQQLFPYRYQLLDTITKTQLTEKPALLIKQNSEWLYSPVAQLQTFDLEHDPLLLFNRYFASQNPFKFNIEQGMLVLSDQQMVWVLILTELADEKLQLDKLESLLSLVDSTSQQITAKGGQLMVTGLPLFTAYGAQSAKQEISTVGLGSSIGIAVLLWLTFRSIKPLLLSALAISAGLFAGLVICVLIFGKIHILTLVFGASLIGVADDYAQHYLCDSFGEKNWHPQKSLRLILPALSLGLLSNLLSYASLICSPFPGLQEVAVFSTIGLLVAWLTVVLLFPVLLTGFKFDHQPSLLKLTRYWEQRWPKLIFNHRRLLSLLLLIIIIGGISLLKPQDDVRLLQSAPVELLNTTDKIQQLLPNSHDQQFFVVSGQNQAEWFNNEQRLLAHLQALSQQKDLLNYDGLSKYWPNPEQQAQNYQLIKSKLVDSGLLDDTLTDLDFDQVAVMAEHNNFAEAELRILSLPLWLKNSDDGKQSLWLGCELGQCQSIVTLTGIRNSLALRGLQDLSGVVLVDQVEQISSLFSRYRLRASGLLAIAFSLATLGLSFKFGWKNALSIMAVPALSIAMSLALLGWFNQLFSLFNLFALLLVLGIGVDYGLFFFMAGSRRASTSLGVTLSALTTLLAFGLLATSSTQIVHAFGFTVAIGIITALLSAPLLGLDGHKP